MLTLVVGLPAAYVVARYEFPGRRLFRAFVTVPFVLPTVVVATAFLALFRPGGPLAFLHWQRGVAPMLVAHVFFNVAVVVRTVGGFWANLDPRREEAARMLGASRRAGVPRRDAAAARARRSPPPRRSCSCSRSRRSASCCCSPIPRTRRSRSRSTARRSSSSTCRSRPRSRSCRSSRCSRCCSCWRGRRSGARSPSGSSRRRDTAAPAPRPRAARRRRGPRRHRRCSSAGRSSCSRSRSLRVGGALVPRGRTARSVRAPRPTRCSCSPWTAVRNSLVFARSPTVDRARRRRAGVGRDRVAARAGRRARWTRS